ncbi:Molecular co-chaperone STI1 [Plasmopara halstedii]|uniref:Molecular co-chaperone STI1 n=1 Tax=Plasmopara halstedii TaxID=4781 RepID=A0A0P1A7Y5_PLAHL|nr:Molecular co-chaperone STI1 [Plasmopara halstedii]CEG36792.1 Molecular co-chaperone STI1 [Plasmopara halstedii]|eukprot:XP_024573161.1 Molecular co-chaperone STI1 [Plasmopara halstedii]
MSHKRPALPTKSPVEDRAGTHSKLSSLEPEAKGQQDLRHAVDLYQKGLEIAHGAISNEDCLKAINCFSLAIATCSNQARFFFARGNTYRSIGDFECAAIDYGFAIMLDDRCALYYANRGACYRKLHQTAKALEDYSNAIKMDSRKAIHFFNRALVLHDAEFYREAIIDFTNALEDGSPAADPETNKSNSIPTGNSNGIGVRLWCRALQIRANCFRRLGLLSKCIEDLRYRGLCYIRLGQKTAAKEQEELKSPPIISSGIRVFARQCLADFSTCIQLDAHNAQAYFYRGSVKLALALDLDLSFSTFTSFDISTSPAMTKARSLPNDYGSNEGGEGINDVIDPLTSNMSNLSAADQLEAALNDIEMALKICPTARPFRICLAMIMQLKQQHLEARSIFETIPSANKSVLVQFHTALCYHALGEYERALELLTDALDDFPDEAIILEARGFMLQETKLFSLAVADYTHALEILESHEESEKNKIQTLRLRYLRGESALRLLRYQDAVDDFAAAIAGGYTANMAAYNARGMAFRGLGDYESALLDLNICVAQAAKTDIFRYHRALCLMECARYAEALPDLHECIHKNTTNSKLLYHLGLCYYHEHQLSECVNFMNHALECEPGQRLLSEIHYYMGLSHALEGRNMDAIEHFTTAYDHSLMAERSIEFENNQDDEPGEATDKQTQVQHLHESQLINQQMHTRTFVEDSLTKH